MVRSFANECIHRHPHIYFVMRMYLFSHISDSFPFILRIYIDPQVAKVHHNGRINYKGQETHADGSHAASQRAHQASLAVLKAAASSPHADEDEEALEEALEEMLEAEIEGQVEEEDDSDDDDLDDNDYHDVEKNHQIQGGDDLIRCIYDSPADTSIIGPQSKSTIAEMKRKTPSSSSSSSSSFPSETITKRKKQSACIPDNFSQIYSAVSVTQQEIDVKFPNFEKIKDKVIKIELTEGDMLYIPAGWYHEVLSCGEDVTAKNTKGNAKGKSHMAFNYWFHPPDDLQNFDKPYTSSFWKEVTESAMKKALEKYTE